MRLWAFLVGSCLLALLPGPALAQPVRLLGDHNAWSAYSAAQGPGPICFVLSRPTATDPLPGGYGESHFYITHRPAEAIRAEINLVSGYVFSADAPATLTVGAASFRLYTLGDSAWLEDVAQTNAALEAIRAGATMVVEGVTDTGMRVRQTFSLIGATAATRAIDAAC